MREIIQKIKLYNFNELDKEIQKKLIKKAINDNLEDYCEFWLNGDMDYSAKEILKEAFGDNATLVDVLYSLSYCQGDGAMMEFTLKYNGEDLEIKHNKGHYYHERSFVIIGNIDGKQYDELKETIIELNEKLTEEGYSYIEGAQNGDIALEYLELSEYYENGVIYEE